MEISKENAIQAFKVFNSDWMCRDFHFEVGKTYRHDGGVVACSLGFHACKKVADCFSYYDFHPNNKIAAVLQWGKIDDSENDKVASEYIKIIKEISWAEMLELANTGKGCSGHSNSGHRNSGDRNSGNCNSGDWNSGNWNSGNCNSGYFNSTKPKNILVFNKECDIDTWDKAEKPKFIYFDLTKWIDFDKMDSVEKKNNPKAETCGGYLKTLSYKEAWAESYAKATPRDIELLKKLPNFDADVFFEISGIRL